MDQLVLDIFNFQDFDEKDFEEATSDLTEFGVNKDELNLNYIDLED